ncbi:hypothetical protein VPH35_027208 [Triticum aestivum]
MGSAISSAIADAAVQYLHLDGPILPLVQQQRLVQRFMDRLERKRRRNHVLYGPRSEVHRSPTCPDRPSPLQFDQQGAEFKPVSPMSCNRVGFRDEIWFHFNFLARRRREKHNFWARGRVAPEPDTSAHKCAFCKGSAGIWHPRNGGFLCGREGQKKEYCEMFMLSERPKKGPEEEPSSVRRLSGELPLAA